MRNIAIILGVSEYKNAKDLPACQNDVQEMNKLLYATEKYEILDIDQTLSKTQMMEIIEGFIGKDVEEKIGEILFYFSGHGYQDDEDLHFVLRETDIQKINGTSLNNREVDDIIRKYDPELFVKIIDACQSGLNYIKDIDIGSGFLLESKKSFQNCIFMSSSKNGEPSIATEEISLFTKTFVEAVLDKVQESIIRYSDIQNYIIDEFKKRQYNQTPFFNIQSDGRAVFAKVTDSLKTLADSHFISHTESFDEDGEIKNRIDTFLEAYREESEVKEIVDKIKEVIEKEKVPLDWLDIYYDVYAGELHNEEYEEDNSLTNFLYERKDKENLYVDIKTKSVKKENIIGIPMFGYEKIPISFTSLVNSLPAYMGFELMPKNMGLPRYKINLVLVYADIGMYIFQGVNQYIRKGWNVYVQGKKKAYSYKWLEYAKFDQDDWKEYVTKQLEDSSSFIKETLEMYVNMNL